MLSVTEILCDNSFDQVEACNFIKKETLDFAKFLRIPFFFTKHLLATASVHFTIFKIFYSLYFTSVCFFKQDSYCYSYLILVV